MKSTYLAPSNRTAFLSIFITILRLTLVFYYSYSCICFKFLFYFYFKNEIKIIRSECLVKVRLFFFFRKLQFLVFLCLLIHIYIDKFIREMIEKCFKANLYIDAKKIFVVMTAAVLMLFFSFTFVRRYKN